MNFAELGLKSPLLEAITAAGYTEPTAVQLEAIPAALAGSDLLVSSHTGSGKTAAFMLPALQRLGAQPGARGKGPRVLVLTPTRELALQINRAALDYGKGLRNLRTAALVGGSSYAHQLRSLERPVDIAVATPGRLIDHLERGRIDLSRVEILVLDEADRMLDMGFLEDVENIVGRTPETRQTMMFSATLDGVVGNLARRLTRDARRIEVVTSEQQHANVEQIVLYADDLSHKNKLLDALLRNPDMQQCVVFAATKMAADQIAVQLEESGFRAASLHGDMHQGQRNRTLQGMREGRTQVLVATDVAARGIDVAGISHVINFDSPRQAEDYVHRIGRTGRAGRTGTAVTLMNHHERHRTRDIERYTGQPLRIETIAGLEPRRRPTKPSFGAPSGPRGADPRRGAPGGPRGGYAGRAAHGSHAGASAHSGAHAGAGPAPAADSRGPRSGPGQGYTARPRSR